MVSEMMKSSSRKRKAARLSDGDDLSKIKPSAKKASSESKDGDSVAKMSLAEFMQKGFSSDEDDNSPQNTSITAGKQPKAKKLKKSDKNGNIKGSPEVSMKQKKKTKTSEKPEKEEKLSKKKESSKKKKKEEEEEEEEEESSDAEDSMEEDDIEDVESDNEVVAKPRTSRIEADSEDEALGEIELSDDGEDDVDEILNTEILTEKRFRSFIENLRAKPDLNQVKRLMEMFSGAVVEAAADHEAKTKYSVKGQNLFNSVVIGCLQDLMPALHKVMKLPTPSVPKDPSKMVDPTKGHLWRKVKNPISLYMVDLLKLIGCITQQKLLLSLLRHVLLILPFVRARPNVEKRMLRTLSRLWATGEESVRVLAFLCLIRLMRGGDDATFQEVLKAMHLSFVANAKFTSPHSWPLISFMKRSLVEAYALRPNVAYQHAFLYIRQLAITLRTALTVKKKDSHKSVYNWQFVHSILLWCHLLATVRTAAMEPLIYPVIQVATGALNLIPGEKYVPLRLHLIRGLMELSAETGTFIPILPMLVSTLKLVRWNVKPKVISMKPMNLSCALRVSDKQTKESAFRDAVLEGFQDMTLTYLTDMSHLMAFPEIVVATVMDLKRLNLRVTKHQTTIKQLLEKITENNRFIEKKREQSGLALKELEKIAALELQIRGDTPLSVYAQKYLQLRQQRIQEANEDIIENYDSEDDKKESAKPKSKKKSAAAEEEEGEESNDDEEEDGADEKNSENEEEMDSD